MKSLISGLVVGVMVVGCSMAGDDTAKKVADPKGASLAAASAVSEIIFGSNRGGPWRVWGINADKSNLHQVIQGAKEEESDVDPCYSADGLKIIFTSTRGGKKGLWISNADGTNVKMLCEGVEGELSPDGKKATFVRNDKVWVRDLDSSKEKQIVPESYKICSGRAWSPDGKTVVFGCRWEGPNALFTVSAEGGEPVKVYDKKPACQPHYSPDGKLLAYETETNICTIQPDGMKNKLVTFWGGVQRFSQWSPDGTKLVYCQGLSEQGPWELSIVPSKGADPSKAVKLTEGASDVNPCWLPVKK